VQRLSGFHAVREALRAGRRPLARLIVAEPLRHREAGAVIELARLAGVPVERVAREKLEHLLPPGVKSQGFVLEAGFLPELAVEELLALGAEGRGRVVLALDGVEDPQNLGAIARSADASGCTGLLLTKRRSAPLSPAVSRASAGAIEHLPVCRATNLRSALRSLREAGFWLVGADAEGSLDLFRAPARVLAGDLVVVLGGEGSGIRPGVAGLLDHRVRIPMRGRVASLNVSAAAAVFLFELARRRG
jgi:23S rRNA (guanosine2251-2'-O)-methyltransferase